METITAYKWQSFKSELTERVQQVEQDFKLFDSRLTRLENVVKGKTENDKINIVNSEKASFKKFKTKKAVKEIANKIQNVEAFMNDLSVERIEPLERKVDKLEKKNERQNSSQLNNMEARTESSNQKSLKTRIKEKAKNFISTLSVHGVPRIVKSDNLLVKLVWTVLILTSVSSGIYIISKSVKDYNQFNVITNIEGFTPERVTFPAVTICTGNALKEDHYKNGTLIDAGKNTDFDLRNFIAHFVSPNHDSNISGLEVFNTFIQVSDGSYHPKVCLRFNGVTAYTNKRLETINRTTDELSLVIKEKYRYIISKDEYTELTLSPLELFVRDNSLNSFTKLEPENLFFNKTYTINMEISETEHKLGEPYNHCTDKYPETGEKNYRQANCIEICRNREIQWKHNCSIPSFYEIKSLKECTSVTSSVYREADKVCENECPKQCETSKIIFKSSPNDSPDSKSSSLRFSFSDLYSHRITQIPKMNEFTLISSIGGALGLFVGARFLSCVEILEFLIEIFYIFFSERAKCLN